MTIAIYIAGPLFNIHERWYLEQISEALVQAGYSTFLPHRDVGVITDFSLEERSRLFIDDLQAIDRCNVCVALLTGADHDSGTSAEIGYAYAKGKPCYGLTDDRRWMNNFIWGLCGMGKHIYSNIPDLLNVLKEHSNGSFGNSA